MKKIIWIIVILVVIFVSWYILAHKKIFTALEDNFDSYNDGDLNGQGGWVTNDASIDIQGIVVRAGEKAVACLSPTKATIASKFFTQNTNGIQGFSMWAAGEPSGTVIIYEDNSVVARVFEGLTYMKHTVAGNNVDWFEPTTNAWYDFEVEWREKNKQVRYRYKETGESGWSDWTAWEDSAHPWSAGPNRITIETDAGTDAYFDEFYNSLKK